MAEGLVEGVTAVIVSPLAEFHVEQSLEFSDVLSTNVRPPPTRQNFLVKTLLDNEPI